MEARTAATPSEALARPTEVDVDVADAVGTVVRGVAAPSRRRPVARPVAMSREVEYAFIKADMTRLVVIAGALFVAMIVLLFIID